jgi:hypothetical protein
MRLVDAIGPKHLGTQNFCQYWEMNDQESYRVPGRWALVTAAGTRSQTARLEFFETWPKLTPKDGGQEDECSIRGSCQHHAFVAL